MERREVPTMESINWYIVFVRSETFRQNVEFVYSFSLFINTSCTTTRTLHTFTRGT